MFIFDVTKIIGYREYVTYISSVKARFDSKKSRLFDRYRITERALWDGEAENYLEFRKKYRKLRQDVVREVIGKFRSFLPKSCLIYEFGSLTKFTDRIESDIDLTICYDEEKTRLFECAEELIDYSIVYVFEHSIDHIHSKFQHYPNVHGYDHLTEKDNLYVLQFDEGSIEYQCGPETLVENVMNIKNVRDYHALLEGYREKYTLKCNIDCLYSIEILENSTEHDFLGDLADLEAQNDIFSDYCFVPAAYAFGNEIEVSYMKKAFKNTIVDLYIMIAYLRKKVKWLNAYSMTMEDVFHSKELAELFGGEYLKHLKERLVEMLFYWDKLELMLKKHSIPLSTRCHKIFTKQELNAMLFEEYHEPDVADQIVASVNELLSVVAIGWSLIHEKIG